MTTAPADQARVTVLLQEWMAGETGALDRLMSAVQSELRRLARVHMKGERHDHTLPPTAVVHEAVIRLQKEGLVRVLPGRGLLICAISTDLDFPHFTRRSRRSR